MLNFFYIFWTPFLPFFHFVACVLCSVPFLDDGEDKKQRHMPEIPVSDKVYLCIDKVQMGLGCVNSWRAVPRKEYRIPYSDREFRFLISPVEHKY